MKRFVKSSSGNHPFNDTLSQSAGAVIYAMETLIDSVDSIDSYEFLTDQEKEEFKDKCSSAAEQMFDLAQTLNINLKNYIDVRYLDHFKDGRVTEGGPMGDI